MDARYVRLVSARREELWQGPGTPSDDLESLRERRGERIAAIDPESNGLLGWITLYPDKDAGGAFLRLADIHVQPEQRGGGIGTALMEKTAELMRERRLPRLKLGTSPLLTWNAGLFMRRCGVRFSWKEGMKTPGGKPWPYVFGEWEPDDPLEKPADAAEARVAERSVLDWDGTRPVARKGVTYSGPLSVPLPELSGEDLIAIVRGSPETLTVLYGVFHELHVHGYGFAWFDVLPEAALPGCRHVYLMEKLFGL